MLDSLCLTRRVAVPLDELEVSSQVAIFEHDAVKRLGVPAVEVHLTNELALAIDSAPDVGLDLAIAVNLAESRVDRNRLVARRATEDGEEELWDLKLVFSRLLSEILPRAWRYLKLELPSVVEVEVPLFLGEYFRLGIERRPVVEDETSVVLV